MSTSSHAVRLSRERRTHAGVSMRLFYGWIIVGVGIVVTCVGFGAMLTLTVFLTPMADAMGWSRTGISTAALVNWLCMGAGAFLWGARSEERRVGKECRSRWS